MIVCAQCKREVAPDGLFCPSCGTAAPQPGEPADPYLGRTVAQKYAVHDLLGRGGMGQVYKATHLTLDRPVALKMLNRALLADPTIVQRFQREARAASRLNHPNSVGVIDFGQTEDGTLFMAMEFLPGRSLASVIAAEFPLDTARVVKIGSQILAALTEAHALGILHCDLKPENVMLETRHDETDVVKVLDFGIARLSGAGGGPRLTQPGMVCGTPGYMSPEQARSEDLDPRSDLYSVGVILYELVTGRMPFAADTPIGLLTKMLAERPPRPSERRPGVRVPADLEAIIMRALSLERQGRPQSADEFRRGLLACGGSSAQPVPAPPTTHDTLLFGRGSAPVGAASPAAGAGAHPSVNGAKGPAGASPQLPTGPPRTPSSLARPPSGPTLKPSTRSRAAGAREPLRPREFAAALPVMVGSVVGALLVSGIVWYALTRIRETPGSVVPVGTALETQSPAEARAGEPASGATPSPAAPPTESPPAPPRPMSPAQGTGNRSQTAERRGAGRGILVERHALNSLQTPPASSGQGILSVIASPGARMSIDGQPAGEPPGEFRLAKGTYQIRASHPAFGTAEETVEVVAGERRLWRATFTK